MTPSDNDRVAARFLSAAGSGEAGRYTLPAEELARLVRLLTDLGEMRLALLTALQTALPRDAEHRPVEELKDALTNLIIMQTRTAGRESGAAESILALAAELRPVPVDSDKLRPGIAALLDAADRVRRAADAPGS